MEIWRTVCDVPQGTNFVNGLCNDNTIRTLRCQKQATWAWLINDIPYNVVGGYYIDMP